MTLPEDYLDAHRRHWTDAECLYEQPRWANADHLYGLSAECGLKAVLTAEGQPVENQYKQHVNTLWPRFQTFATGRTNAGYVSMLPAGEPFSNWDISQRYAHQSQFSKVCVEPHRDAARAVRAMVQLTIQDGRP